MKLSYRKNNQTYKVSLSKDEYEKYSGLKEKMKKQEIEFPDINHFKDRLYEYKLYKYINWLKRFYKYNKENWKNDEVDFMSVFLLPVSVTTGIGDKYLIFWDPKSKEKIYYIPDKTKPKYISSKGTYDSIIDCMKDLISEWTNKLKVKENLDIIENYMSRVSKL